MPMIKPTPRRVEKAMADSRNKGREGMTRSRDRLVSSLVSVFFFSHVLLLLNVNLFQLATYMEPEKKVNKKTTMPRPMSNNHMHHIRFTSKTIRDGFNKRWIQ